MVVALSDISRWSKPDPPSEKVHTEEAPVEEVAALQSAELAPESLTDATGMDEEYLLSNSAVEENEQAEHDSPEGQEGPAPGTSDGCLSCEDAAVSEGDESEAEESSAPEADPLKQYVLAMSTSLFLIWLPFALNATGVLGGKYEFAGARAQAMVNIFTAIAVPASLIGIIVCGGKTKSLWASVGLAAFLVVALSVGGLPLAFKAVGTWQALMRDRDPNLQKLNEEMVNARTKLVLYSYNPPLERTRRVLRAEEEVLPGILLIKLQAQKSD